jgi:hypothetical protein
VIEAIPDPVPSEAEFVAEAARAEESFRAARIDENRVLIDETDGVREILHLDGDKFAIERVQDVEETLEWCKGRYNEGLVNRNCEFRQIASLPENALVIWGKGRGIDVPNWYLKKEYQDLVVEAAHDRDLSGFRTLPGHYSRRG